MAKLNELFNFLLIIFQVFNFSPVSIACRIEDA